MKSVADQAKKWMDRTAASADAYKKGVQGVTVSPTEKAAQAVDRQVAGVQAAAASGRTQRALQRVTLASWQQAAVNKGAQRLATGAAAGQAAYQAYAQDVRPTIEAIQAQVANMPKGGVENAVARARVAIEAMMKYKDNK